MTVANIERTHSQYDRAVEKGRTTWLPELGLVEIQVGPDVYEVDDVSVARLQYGSPSITLMWKRVASCARTGSVLPR